MKTRKELFPKVCVYGPSNSNCILDLWDDEYSAINSEFGDVAHLVEILVSLYCTQPDIKKRALSFQNDWCNNITKENQVLIRREI